MHLLLHYKIYPALNRTIPSPPLLILHGLLGSMDNWRSQAKRLSQTQTVITIDLRNHGHSPHLDGMSYRQMGLDILAIIDYEHLIGVNLMGHSMGGKIAMWLALHYPAQINRLIVVDIAPKTYPLWHQKILTAMLMAPLSNFQSRQDVDYYFSQFIEDRKERFFLSKNIQKRVGEGYKWRCNLKAIVRSYLKIAAFPVSDLVFSNKTCFIRGGNSKYIEKDDYPLIQHLFPNSEIYTLENSAHLPHIEQADGFYQQVIKFLK